MPPVHRLAMFFQRKISSNSRGSHGYSNVMYFANFCKEKIKQKSFSCTIRHQGKNPPSLFSTRNNLWFHIYECLFIGFIAKFFCQIVWQIPQRCVVGRPKSGTFFTETVSNYKNLIEAKIIFYLILFFKSVHDILWLCLCHNCRRLGKPQMHISMANSSLTCVNDTTQHLLWWSPSDYHLPTTPSSHTSAEKLDSLGRPKFLNPRNW